MALSLSFPTIRRGFSLLELLLVIFIISLVYFLGFEGFEKTEKKEEKITPMNLKKELLKGVYLNSTGTLLCTDKCRICYFRKTPSDPFETIKAPLLLKNTKSYLLNQRNELFSPNYGRYNDKEVCLWMDFYPNGSATQIILENDKGIYFLPAFFGLPQKVDSLEKAQALWMAHNNDLKERSDYY